MLQSESDLTCQFEEARVGDCWSLELTGEWCEGLDDAVSMYLGSRTVTWVIKIKLGPTHETTVAVEWHQLH